MSPIDYMERTRAFFEARGFPPYRWVVNESAPWTTFKKPLESCRVALLSSGGVYHKDQTPFNPDRDDLTFREIPRDVDVKELRIQHNNYDHRDADQDVNCVFPIERFRELEVEGYIGELAPTSYTLMGRIFRLTALRTELAPQIVQKLKEEQVDVLFAVPA